ncbi:rhomboid family intramembrane serine protease [Dysgonomonas termitidis]|uniref:Rhomboid family intramembrane serine protease n=1 Tax=Dysgonomonas termitidis TaxID=1516126 RepID=A0ABV9L2A9_9BACT
MKYIFIIICIIVYFLPVDILLAGYSDNSPVYTFFIYMVFHKSFIHLSLNMMSFYFIYGSINIKDRLFLLLYPGSVLIAFLSSMPEPTIGASGLIYILCGIRSGAIITIPYKFIPFFTLVISSITIGFLLPGINGLIHLLGFSLGFLAYIVKSIFNETDSVIHKGRE